MVQPLSMNIGQLVRWDLYIKFSPKYFQIDWNYFLVSYIGEAQSAFIRDKQILDGVFMANEIIHHWKKQEGGGLILKLDF